MLSNKHVREEIENIEKIIKSKDVTAGEAANLKCLTLLMKLLVNVRTNQVIWMKHNKVDLEKINKTASEDKEQ